MQNPRRRVDLLRRLGRMREVEKQTAALRVAEAQGTHGKLEALRDRSGEIASFYAKRDDARDGGELTCQLHFLSGLEKIRHETEQERVKAEENTDEAMLHLREAERKREVTSDRMSEEQRSVDRLQLNREMAMNPTLARKSSSLAR